MMRIYFLLVALAILSAPASARWWRTGVPLIGQAGALKFEDLPGLPDDIPGNNPFERVQALYESANEIILKEDVAGWFAGRWVSPNAPTDTLPMFLIGEERQDSTGGTQFKVQLTRLGDASADRYDAPSAEDVRIARSHFDQNWPKYRAPRLGRTEIITGLTSLNFRTVVSIRRSGRLLAARVVNVNADGASSDPVYVYFFKTVTPHDNVQVVSLPPVLTDAPVLLAPPMTATALVGTGPGVVPLPRYADF